MSHVTISRFARDRGVFASLQRDVLAALAGRTITRGSESLDVWSAGCASGDEPYTLAIMWQLELAADFPALAIQDPRHRRRGMRCSRGRGCRPGKQLRRAAREMAAAAFLSDDRCYRVNDSFTGSHGYPARDPQPTAGRPV